MVKTYDLQNTSMGYEAYMEMVESLDIHGKPDGQGDWVRTVNYDAIAAARQHEFAYIEKVLKACSKATASDIRDELRDLRAWAANRSTCFSVETLAKCQHRFEKFSNGIVSCQDCGEPQEAPAKPIDQAPIARVIVTDDAPAGVVLYSPGLPPGEFDVYLEPTSDRGEKK